MVILLFPLWFQVRTRPDRLGSVLITTEIRSLATNQLPKGLAVFDTRERLISVHHSPPQSRLGPNFIHQGPEGLMENLVTVIDA